MLGPRKGSTPFLELASSIRMSSEPSRLPGLLRGLQKAYDAFCQGGAPYVIVSKQCTIKTTTKPPNSVADGCLLIHFTADEPLPKVIASARNWFKGHFPIGGRRPGAGRPPAGKVARTWRVLPETAAKIEKLAKEKDFNPGEIIDRWAAAIDKRAKELNVPQS